MIRSGILPIDRLRAIPSGTRPVLASSALASLSMASTNSATRFVGEEVEVDLRRGAAGGEVQDPPPRHGCILLATTTNISGAARLI
jgi:hypothetical protein